MPAPALHGAVVASTAEAAGFPAVADAAEVVDLRAAVVAVGAEAARRSDIALKHDVSLLGVLDNGLGYYRFSYLGSAKAYVGVIAQEVQRLMPRAVTRGDDGFLRVDYRSLGIRFLTYRDWLAANSPIPARTGM